MASQIPVASDGSSGGSGSPERRRRWRLAPSAVATPEQQRGHVSVVVVIVNAAAAAADDTAEASNAATPVAATASVPDRSWEHVRLGLPARRPGRVRRRYDSQRQAAAVRYVPLFGVRRLHVQPLLVLEHRVHHHAKW